MNYLLYLLAAFFFYFETVNHNKAWLFEGSFFGGEEGGEGQFDPLFHISRITYPISINFIELLNNEIYFIIKIHKKSALHSIFKK